MIEESSEQPALTFTFPVDREPFEDCSWPEIKEVLAREREAYIIQCSYRFVMTRKKYLYVRCSKCSSQLKFRKREDDSLQLVFFHNKHNHSSIS